VLFHACHYFLFLTVCFSLNVLVLFVCWLVFDQMLQPMFFHYPSLPLDVPFDNTFIVVLLLALFFELLSNLDVQA